MAKLSEIVSFLDEFLKISDIEDKSYNGLQFEGKQDIRKIILAVDAGVETFEKAAAAGADLIIVHYGNFWKFANPSFKGANKKRLHILYKNNISLYAAHLPLDRHRIVGNNAQLIQILGGNIKSEFIVRQGKNIGWLGAFKKPVLFSQIVAVLEKELDTKAKVLAYGKQKILTIAVCSGGGGYSDYDEAVSLGADAFLTGDTSELYHAAKDNGMNVIFAGHHATEILGVKALAKVVEKKFKIKCEFLEIKTGL
jgi:dinuclear metal center YbgI/SA1388 family protein